MNLTIIRDMGRVFVDGTGHDDLDMSLVPAEVAALQWQNTLGEIEYVDKTKGNTVIDVLPEWAATLASERQQAILKEAEEKQAEENARIAYENSYEGKAEIARNQRFFLLMETDWWASSDLTMTAAQAAYRQALRDISSQEGFPENIIWPEKP